MIRFAAFLMMMAGTACAQSWSHSASDNGGYAAGSTFLPGYQMSITCYARSLQNLPLMQTGWHETDVAPPYHVSLGFTSDLIPNDSFERRDITFFVDDTGYRLPQVNWNEMEGGWGVELPMSDAMVQALPRAQRLVMQVGNQFLWELPVAGLAQGLAASARHCNATWAARADGTQPAAAPRPATPSGVFQLPPQVQADVNAKCEGRAQISADALSAGDLDGDGAPDVAVDYRNVTCPGRGLNHFCGAANCSIDVYFSSRGYLNPDQLLGIGAAMVPLPSGGLGLGVSGTWSLCGENGCDNPFIWDGTRLERN